MPPQRLTLATYNVLAQSLASSRYFPYASPYLKGGPRLIKLTERIRALDADVICLSEAYTELLVSLQGLGYGVISKAKKAHGIAILYKTSILECTKSAASSFDDVFEALAENGVEHSNPPVPVFRTSSLGLFASLRFKSTGAHFSVANSHLYWDPRVEVVKAAQALTLLRCASEFSACYAPSSPMFVCGDMNSMPDSVVHKLFLEGLPALPSPPALPLPWDIASCVVLDTERDEEPVKAWRKSLCNCLVQELKLGDSSSSGGGGVGGGGSVERKQPLSSVYAIMGAEAPTTYTQDFSGCIDHIFIRATMDNITVEKVLPLPTFEALGGPIPNAKEGSDHLPLSAVLSWES